ncbi:MAG: putative toxin-antitoxin system toxin component, PIN family [Candidatus Shapirobacteria bacterium]|jgi:putative PIN family toxin of toxin-antitoxin system
MTKVVLDTNIIVSAIVFGGKPREIMDKVVLGGLRGYISKFIIYEVRAVLGRKFDFSSGALDKVERLLLEDFELVEPKKEFKKIKQLVADNRIVECALEARADYLVSGDKKHILPLKRVGKISLVSAEEILDILRLG